jgi:hypothetical protein
MPAKAFPIRGLSKYHEAGIKAQNLYRCLDSLSSTCISSMGIAISKNTKEDLCSGR